MNNLLTNEAFPLLIAVVIYLVKTWLASKDSNLNKHAETIQTMVLSAITESRSMIGDKTIISEDMGKYLKNAASLSVMKNLSKNIKVTKFLKNIGITINNTMIDQFIELALHSAKLGIDNVVKNNIVHKVRNNHNLSPLVDKISRNSELFNADLNKPKTSPSDTIEIEDGGSVDSFTTDTPEKPLNISAGTDTIGKNTIVVSKEISK